MAKKATKKWNRVHFFVKEKKCNADMKKIPEEHPAYVFEQSKTHYKAIHFTSHPTTHGNENVRLKHNIDPKEEQKATYAVPYSEPRSKKEYQPPDKKYRIHRDDVGTINKLKHKKCR